MAVLGSSGMGWGFGGLVGDRNTLGRDLCSSRRCRGDTLSPLWVSLGHRGFPAQTSTKGCQTPTPGAGGGDILSLQEQGTTPFLLPQHNHTG